MVSSSSGDSLLISSLSRASTGRAGDDGWPAVAVPGPAIAAPAGAALDDVYPPAADIGTLKRVGTRERLAHIREIQYEHSLRGATQNRRKTASHFAAENV